MRLAAQATAGFYPISPVVVADILKHIYLADKSKDYTILDPCCGEGLAIKQLAEGLGVPQSHVYAVELDLGRWKAAKANMPEAQFCNGPASFMGTQIMRVLVLSGVRQPPVRQRAWGWATGRANVRDASDPPAR